MAQAIIPTCILHVDGATTEPIKLFEHPTWTKVVDIHSKRRSMYTLSKFNHISLPDAYDSSIGYHSKCYKNFTALRRCSTELESVPESSGSSALLRTNVSHPGTSKSGVFDPKCIFCDKYRKWLGRDKPVELPATLEYKKGELTIHAAAKTLNDQALLAKIGGQDLIAKELRFHNSCRKSYTNKARRLSGKESSHAPTDHKQALESIKVYVQETLIDSEGSEKLTSLFERYTTALVAECTAYTAQKLSDRLMQAYPGLLKIYKRANKEGVVLHSHSLDNDTAYRRANFDVSGLKEAAFYLRKQILSSQSTELPNPLTVEAMQTGQANKPDDLMDFFTMLYTGSSANVTNEKTKRLIDSVTDDVIYATSHGQTKTGKHLSLALGIKSLTGSRRVLEILNRFGHCTGYHVAETIETQFATEIAARNRAIPDGMCSEPNLCTSLAWDNYDEFTETLSGKGTLHDTVGICYQNLPVESALSVTADEQQTGQQPETTTSNTESQAAKPSSSSRSFKMSCPQIEPYRKKAKTNSFVYPEKEVADPPHSLLIKCRDLFWMMSVATHPKTPMWIGWNAKITPDPHPKQRIGYMQNINLPPTRLDVVAETLKKSQQVAQECHQDYAVVTYDLAVAKFAMQVQLDDAPLYDNVFVGFGAFHILLAFFASLGYLLDGSGGPDILTETEVLAGGSLNGFLSGKHYNRCKRLHPLLAVAFQVLHFKSFLAACGPLAESLVVKMSDLMKSPSADLMQEIEACPEYENLMIKYMDYVAATHNGEHGSTARWWITYVELVAIYHRFNRACRTNDVDLFIASLREMIPIFFAASRPNYSRWMVRYFLNLVNMDETHPGVRQILANGAMSIRRTDKPFSRNAVDLTLEQTINADAASRKTGIAAFSSSESARQRWTITRFTRSAIVGNLLIKAGLKKSEDVTQSLRPHRVKKDREDLDKLVHCIENTMNPFDVPPKDVLYNTVTGKEVPNDVKDDLLHCQQIGEKWHQEFVLGCFNDEARFNKPIRRRKVKNFTTAAPKRRVRGKDEKLLELQSTRDLFGRLLYISTQEKVDMAKVLKYPLLEFPLALSHVDGSLTKTDKSQLMHKLESSTESTPPAAVDITLIDAMFHLHILQDIPETYGAIAGKILRDVCQSKSHRIDFICDTYHSPSIKDVEHVNRSGGNDASYCITGRDQKRPKDWSEALKSSTFKTSFFQFLAQEWREQSQADALTGHTVYLALDEVCYRFMVQDGVVTCDDMQDYHCQHEEADTRIIYHLVRVLEEDPSRHVVVRCNDTDIIILLLYHCSLLPQSPHAWMDAGLSGKNTRRYINIQQLLEELQSEIVNGLLGLHALTGTDYTAAFMNKGKVRPFNLMSRSTSHAAALAKLGDENDVTDDLMRQVESFVCELYGYPDQVNVDTVRYLIFQAKCAPKDDSDPLNKIKGLNPSAMPTCRQVLLNKVKRANFVAAMWKKARTRSPVTYSPIGNGWCLVTGKYHIQWYDGDQVPPSLSAVLDSDALDDDDNDDNIVPSDSDDDSDSEVV